MCGTIVMMQLYSHRCTACRAPVTVCSLNYNQPEPSSWATFCTRACDMSAAVA